MFIIKNGHSYISKELILSGQPDFTTNEYLKML